MPFPPSCLTPVFHLPSSHIRSQLLPQLLPTMASIASARYGKDNVRVYKVERHDDGTQTVHEMTVCVLLEGAIEPS